MLFDIILRSIYNYFCIWKLVVLHNSQVSFIGGRDENLQESVIGPPNLQIQPFIQTFISNVTSLWIISGKQQKLRGLTSEEPKKWNFLK